MVVERQRDDIEVSLDDMNEEADSTHGELSDDSDSVEAVVSGGRLMKIISVPTFTAETLHGTQGSTLQAIHMVTGCLEMEMVIKSGAETHTVMAYAKEGDTETISWVKNIVTIIILEQTRGVTECL